MFGQFRIRMMWRSHGSSAFQTPYGAHPAIGVALAASVGFVPGAASAAPNESPAPVSARAAKDAPVFAYVVNTRVDHRTIAYVKRAIAKAWAAPSSSRTRRSA